MTPGKPPTGHAKSFLACKRLVRGCGCQLRISKKYKDTFTTTSTLKNASTTSIVIVFSFDVVVWSSSLIAPGCCSGHVCKRIAIAITVAVVVTVAQFLSLFAAESWCFAARFSVKCCTGGDTSTCADLRWLVAETTDEEEVICVCGINWVWRVARDVSKREEVLVYYVMTRRVNKSFFFYLFLLCSTNTVSLANNRKESYGTCGVIQHVTSFGHLRAKKWFPFLTKGRILVALVFAILSELE